MVLVLEVWALEAEARGDEVVLVLAVWALEDEAKGAWRQHQPSAEATSAQSQN